MTSYVYGPIFPSRETGPDDDRRLRLRGRLRDERGGDTDDDQQQRQLEPDHTGECPPSGGCRRRCPQARHGDPVVVRAEGDQRHEQRRLREQQLPVGGVPERVEGAHLEKAAHETGCGERDHRGDREQREPGNGGGGERPPAAACCDEHEREEREAPGPYARGEDVNRVAQDPERALEPGMPRERGRDGDRGAEEEEQRRGRRATPVRDDRDHGERDAEQRADSPRPAEPRLDHLLRQRPAEQLAQSEARRLHAGQRDPRDGVEGEEHTGDGQRRPVPRRPKLARVDDEGEEERAADGEAGSARARCTA